MRRSLAILMHNRPSWHEYFFAVAENISKRSTCTHASIGAVYVSRDHDILSTGYNGAPRGFPHCIDGGCDGDEKNFCQGTVHAEVNGIIQAARKGISLIGCDVYITAFPCYNCFKALANLQVSTIYYGYKYKPEKYGAQYEKVEQRAKNAHITLISKGNIMTLAMRRNGKIIVFEGGEGTGKGTQVDRLQLYFAGKYGADRVISTHEPGGGIPDYREKIFDLKKTHPDATPDEIAKMEFDFFIGDRAVHVRNLLRPKKDGGCIVLCDRFAPSSVAYQGYGRGMNLADIMRANERALQGLTPDLIVLMDLDPKIGLDRKYKNQPEKLNRFELEGYDFHYRVRKGYYEQVTADSDRWLVVDASQDINAITKQLINVLHERLGI